MGSPAAPEPPERAELAAELLDLAPFWHSSLLEPQTAAERYRLPATGPPTARQAMGIDVLAARALCRRLRVTTVGELFGLLDARAELAFKNRGLALRKLEAEVRAAVPFRAHAARLVALFKVCRQSARENTALPSLRSQHVPPR